MDKVLVGSFSPKISVSPVNSETITSSTSSDTGTIGPLAAAVPTGLSHYPTSYKASHWNMMILYYHEIVQVVDPNRNDDIWAIIL